MICPTAPAATVKRPLSKEAIAILNPSPSSPSKFSFGTLTFSKNNSPVFPARIPNFPLVAIEEKPSQLRSTINAEIPLCFSDLSLYKQILKNDQQYHIAKSMFFVHLKYNDPRLSQQLFAAPPHLIQLQVLLIQKHQFFHLLLEGLNIFVFVPLFPTAKCHTV